MWSFQIGFVGALATGLGALLALERDTPRRNAAAIAVALRRRPAQAWIPLVPLALFGLWFVTYGRDAAGRDLMVQLRDVPGYAIDSAASGIASLTGFAPDGWFADTIAWRGPLLALAVVAFGSNLALLASGFRIMRDHADDVRADLGALEIARGTVAPGFRLVDAIPTEPSLPDVPAGRYFSEVDAHGSPGWPPERITTAGGGVAVVNRGDGALGIGLRRFAPVDRPRRLGPLPGRAAARILIAVDGATGSWRVTSSGRSTLQVCPL